MLKGLLAGVVLTIAGAAVAGYALVKSGYIPANADGTPSSLETWVAKTSLDATLQRLAPKENNPVALTSEHLLQGVQLFARNCAVCHGSATGSASASPIAKGLYQHPPQLGSDGVEDDPEGEIFWKVKHGLRLTGMPSFGATLSDQEIWTLALFLKHMDKLPPPVQQAWQQVKNWPVTGTE